MILTDFLTQIADSIRSKDGTAEPILATDFPQRILDLPTGNSDIKVATGTIILAEDKSFTWSQYSSKYMEIEHGLGVIPNFAIVYDADFIDSDSYPAITGAFINLSDFGMIPYRSFVLTRTYDTAGGMSSDVKNATSYGMDTRFTENTYRFGVTNNCYIIAGRKYSWIIGRV